MYKLPILSFCILLFFSVSLNVYPALVLGIFAITLLTLFMRNYSNSFKKEMTFSSWIFLVITFTVSIVFNEKNIENILYVGLMLTTILIFYLVMIDGKIVTFIKKIFFLLSGLHVFFVLLQSQIPELVLKVNAVILPLPSYIVSYSQVTRGMYAGLTGQVGAAAFFITIQIAYLSVKLFVNNTLKYKALYFIGLIVSFYALLLTTKRALLIFNILILIIYAIYKLLINKTKIERILFLIFGLIVGLSSILILFNYKRPILNNTDEFSSGRLSLYSETLMISKDNFLTGIGFGNVELILGEKTHNIYIQILAEVGILGLLVLLIALFIPLIDIFKKIMYINKNLNLHLERHRHNLYLSFYMQLVFIFYGLLGNPLYDYFIFGIYLFFVCLGLNTKYEIEEGNKHEKNWSTNVS